VLPRRALRISCGRTRSPDRVEGEPHLSAFTRALRRRVPCLPLAYTKSLVLYTLNEATSAAYLYLKAGHWCYGVKGSSRLLATPFPLQFGTLVSPFNFGFRDMHGPGRCFVTGAATNGIF